MSKEFQSKLRWLVSNLPPDLRVRAEHDISTLLRARIDSFELLVSALQDPQMAINLRIVACWVLGQLRDKRDVNVLLSAFNDQDSRLSWEAAKSLAIVRSKRALRPLIITLVEAEDSNKRQAAAYALGWLCDKRAVEPLLKTLTQRSEDERVRSQAAESLGFLKDKRAAGPLIVALKDPSTEVRFWSAFALGQLGDRRALPQLKRLATTDKTILDGWWEVSKEASDAIACIRAQEN
jgi:HEAT repeat protein